MSDELSAYEIKRLETIKANRLMLESLGLVEAAAAVRAEKPKQHAPKQKKAAASAPVARRHSRRFDDGDADLDAPDEHEAEQERARNADNVGQMTEPERRAWCRAVLDHELEHKWLEELSAEQRARVERASEEWLPEFVLYTACPDGGRSLSRANLSVVVRNLLKLVSGAGYTCTKREGAFAAGRKIGLGITATAVTALRAEAQCWLPQHTCPTDLLGMCVTTPTGDVTLTKKGWSGPIDTSNGWALNHPLKKLQLYCEHLDEEAAVDDDMRQLVEENVDLGLSSEEMMEDDNIQAVREQLEEKHGEGMFTAARERRLRQLIDEVTAEPEDAPESEGRGQKRGREEEE